jgi:hypothetical protein
MRAIFDMLFEYIRSIVLYRFKAWLSRSTKAGACDVQMLTGLLYETTPLHLLRWNYAGRFQYAV